jgi:F420-dependent oxidoreductase-like protein
VTSTVTDADGVDLPDPCLVVLVGPGASGKSTWAGRHFTSEQIVSTDRLRALVGTGEDDLDASEDAFALLDEMVRMRLGRRLTTVVDTLGLDAGRRRRWLDLAREYQVACVAVAFDISPGRCRELNRARPRPIPAQVLTQQIKAWSAVRPVLAHEGFARVIAPAPVRLVAPGFTGARAAASRQRQDPVGLRFGLHRSSFDAAGGAPHLREWLRQTAMQAELAGFDAIYVMDHFRQIPQVGRAWDDFLESYTTLAYLAACTERVRLGALVTAITYRNVAHLGKIVATLDVISGGRAVCGVGLGWFSAEHAAYGWRFPTAGERYDLLQDALELLPLLWGPGSPAFSGRVLQVPEALCYPRPLQEHVPLIVGGGGEKRTLRLAAQYADAANVMGDLATVRHKAAVLAEHCTRTGRQVALTHLSTALVADGPGELARRVDAGRPRGLSPARYTARVNAGTVSDHVGRFRELAEAGVSEVMVRLADTDSLEPMAEVIAAFR